MKSPFPGMDPYIEECRLFEDFHDALIREIHVSIADRHPDRYVARVAERPYVVIADSNGKDAHAFKPDVGVVAISPAAPTGGVAVAELASDLEAVPMRAFIATDYRENFVEIYITEPERILVTCIEVLSPSNKRRNTAGWETYLRKRQGLLLGAASLVEIDLLRGGERFPMLDAWPTNPYTLLVARRAQSACRRVWPAHFDRPLPTIPVPLVAPDEDISLDLQPMIETIYARSRYDRDIDYTQSLSPAFTTEQAAWLAERVRQRAIPPANGASA